MSHYNRMGFSDAPLFVALRTNLYEVSCHWMHMTQQTIHLLSWRCGSAWSPTLSSLVRYYKHSATIIVVIVGGIVIELSACEG